MFAITIQCRLVKDAKRFTIYMHYLEYISRCAPLVAEALAEVTFDAPRKTSSFVMNARLRYASAGNRSTNSKQTSKGLFIFNFLLYRRCYLLSALLLPFHNAEEIGR